MDAVPETMRAVRVREHGGPEAMRVASHPERHAPIAAYFALDLTRSVDAFASGNGCS